MLSPRQLCWVVVGWPSQSSPGTVRERGAFSWFVVNAVHGVCLVSARQPRPRGRPARDT